MACSFGLRKGAWTEEEDILLRKCIEKYGEGNWRQVPLRAGLRRCRKSCRLRWLNYLHPDIKRGVFTPDEVDLLIRLHKLLGNRWSLMAGRLPGRTANNIKNYWNTHLKKQLFTGGEEVKANTTVEQAKVIKPRPWKLPKSSPWLRSLPASIFTEKTTTSSTESREGLITASSSLLPENPMLWWDGFVVEKGTPCLISESGEELINNIWVDDMEPMFKGVDTFVEDGNSGWDDLCIDGNLWDALELE